MLSQGVLFLINALLDIACVLLLARFLIQASRADFYNPISQGIVRITDPLLKPLRKVIPPIGNLDTVSFLMAWFVKGLAVVMIVKFNTGSFPSILLPVVEGLFEVLKLTLNIYFFALIVIVVLSWVAPGNYHPAAMLLYQITEPLVAPVRRVIPPLGGLDLSVMVVFLLLIFVRDFVLLALFNALF